MQGSRTLHQPEVVAFDGVCRWLRQDEVRSKTLRVCSDIAEHDDITDIDASVILGEQVFLNARKAYESVVFGRSGAVAVAVNNDGQISEQGRRDDQELRAVCLHPVYVLVGLDISHMRNIRYGIGNDRQSKFEDQLCRFGYSMLLERVASNLHIART